MDKLGEHIPYDQFAWVYNRHWGPHLIDRIFPVIEHLLLEHIPDNAHIVDLCCGTGWLARALTVRRYTVTGIDCSQAMLSFACINAPEAKFVLDDVCTCSLPTIHHAVVSTYNSLNHILTLTGITSVFHNVYNMLQSNGYFLFDLNTDQAYRAFHGASFCFVEADHVCAVRMNYAIEDRIRQSSITLFQQHSIGWQRSDFTITERCYSVEDITTALQIAGFVDIALYDAERDFKLQDPGRMFVICRKIL